MGLLAVIDTFLVYRIAEYRYNKTVAFIAAVLFAVMPITWILRKILLEPILLPFLLLSILFALYNKDNSIHFKFNAADKNIWRSKIESIFPILLSGIFLGLSIFTKVSAFAMIPLIGYLICISTSKNQSNNNKNSSHNHINIRKLGIWFIPVVLIPLIWPIYSVSIGKSLLNSLVYIFQIDPITFVLGCASIVFSYNGCPCACVYSVKSNPTTRMLERRTIRKITDVFDFIVKSLLAVLYFKLYRS